MNSKLVCGMVTLMLTCALPLGVVNAAGIAWLAEKPVNPEACSHMNLNCSPEGVFHLTFADMTEEMIKDFQRGTYWYGTKDVVSIEAPFYGCSAIDYANLMPVCVYEDYFNDDIRFSLYVSNEWTGASAVTGGSSARQIRIDMEGPTFHIAYNYDTPGNNHCDLKYISNPGGVWLEETVDRLSNTTMIDQFDFKLGFDGLPHFAWFDPIDQCIYFATRTGTNTYDIEEAFAPVTSCTWLELDYLNANPIIAFVDASGSGDQTLRYTYYVAGWYDNDVISWDSIDAVDMALAEDESIATFHFYFIAAMADHFYCIRPQGSTWVGSVIDDLEGYSTNAVIQADWDILNDRIGVGINLIDEDKMIFIDGSPYTPTPRPNTPTPTPTWTVAPGTPTFTPIPPTATPTTEPGEPTNTPIVPTATPSGDKGTVLVIMPDAEFSPGENCFCQVKYSMPTQQYDMPLFVLLDVWGSYFFYPSFSTTMDFSRVDPGPVPTTEYVVPEFAWPSGVGSAAGIVWWAALTNESMTELMSNLGTFTFGWTD